MPIEIPDVVMGGPDLRPPVARMLAAGVPAVEVAGHRLALPAVVSADVEVGVPAARVDAPAGVVAEPVRSRRDVAVEPFAAPASRAGRVPFVEAPYRRRVRMGIDS